ncbi:hypothetical protein BS47DRAFT_62831 [Hydnum rufescens UP504]|uniref:Uncharacterized protein n=1 Tax=Hydnum rufescens UP504 TaxID=1448309 RepID=A0A9P6DTE3_9AGAM|nr:hypothetical protein BS47DRAFT_62831 [Hydnum rufescens UP504]
MSFILMLSQHHRLLAAERVSGELRPNEADSRIPLDALISFIFRTLEPYEGNKMRQICECPLTLPASSLALSSAIADLAVCIRMTNFCLPLPQHVRNEITAIDLDAADQVSPNLLVLHWLVE